MAGPAKELFRKTVAAVTGQDPQITIPLGGTAVSDIPLSSSPGPALYETFTWCVNGGTDNRLPSNETLRKAAERAESVFCSFYEKEEHAEKAREALTLLNDPAVSNEEKANIISEIWAPETAMDREEILRRWKLTEVRPNQKPIKPTEILLQFNALYTLPEAPENVPEIYRKQAATAVMDPGSKIADYDHPVHLFEGDENHEVINCLRELEEDLAFEKKQKVIPADYRMPVLLSVSVTHRNLDAPCGAWLLERIKSLGLTHMRVYVLTEQAVDAVKEEALTEAVGVYSVFGKYGVHFNALKYTQLLFERAYGTRGGFKLDTDEGIRSRDLFEVTGKTWLQTLCHELWGGTAVDWRGKPVELAFNLGEYINEKDIDRLGYKQAMREPDVKGPSSPINGDIFFNKGYAHAKATALYNEFSGLSDTVSHTVVKGGGYGITNHGLRAVVPFTFSLVGRAEDQQFYFSGLAGGARGIFHPDLRIAHYKGTVAESERKTAVSRFIGDMYRLIIFQYLVAELGVKEDIDPMPGVFAGELARAQAFFHILYKALQYVNNGDTKSAETLIGEGWEELENLMEAIDSGKIKRQYASEREEWKRFISAASSVRPEKMRSILEQFVV